MARLMSVAYTEEQVRARTKHVTRRAGWEFARPGDRVILCRKVMGRQGTPLVRIVAVELLDVRREPLALMIERPDYGDAEVTLEGFPDLSPLNFIEHYFEEAQGIGRYDDVTRLEWVYREDACLRCGLDASPGWREGDEWQASHYCAPCLLGPVPEQRAAGLIR
jgi:hypothetical protein